MSLYIEYNWIMTDIKYTYQNMFYKYMHYWNKNQMNTNQHNHFVVNKDDLN